MNWGRRSYRIIRSILLTAVATIVTLYLLLYIAVSLPFVQNKIRLIAEEQLSEFLDTDVAIGKVSIHPFNEVIVKGLSVKDQSGTECIYADRVGAGINIKQLLLKRKIEITYAEIIGLDGKIYQETKDSPLNIDFIIKAFEPKDKTKPPTLFDLKIREVVIRKSSLSFDRQWMPRLADNRRIDFNHLKINNLKADVSIPVLKNEDFEIRLRRLALSEQSGLVIDKLTVNARITDTQMALSDIEILMPGTKLALNEQTLNYEGFNDIGAALRRRRHAIYIDNAIVTPSDFAPFYPALAVLDNPLTMTLIGNGDLEDIDIQTLTLKDDSGSLDIGIEGKARFGNKDITSADLSRLAIRLSDNMIGNLQTLLPTDKALSPKISETISALGDITLDCHGRYRPGHADFEAMAETSLGALETSATLNFAGRKINSFEADITTPGFNLAPFDARLSNVSLTANAKGSIHASDIEGEVQADIIKGSFMGIDLSGLSAEVSKYGNKIAGLVTIDNPSTRLTAEGDATLDGENSEYNLMMDIGHLIPAQFGLTGVLADYTTSGSIQAEIAGNSLNNLRGNIDLTDMTFAAHEGNTLVLNDLYLSSDIIGEGMQREINILSDYIDGYISGKIDMDALVPTLRSMVAAAVPSLLEDTEPWTEETATDAEDFDYSFTIKKNDIFTELFKLPVTMLTDIPISGHISSSAGTASLSVDIPYLQQGKDKLIRATTLRASLDAVTYSFGADISTIYPAKNDDVSCKVSLQGHDSSIDTQLAWDFNRPKAYRGDIALHLDILENNALDLSILPSQFQVNDSTWTVEAGKVRYADNKIDVSGMKAWHAKQYVTIGGSLSDSDDDRLIADLKDIDLNYIFETLSINYVTFGGRASGKALASGLLGGDMKAYTEGLKVKALTYNGALLGDADLHGEWDNAEKEVKIYADIAERGKRRAIVDGGIWVTRDSLSLDFDADHVNIKFLQPFMMAFSSDIRGEASGHAKLYGTFSDIDLVGRLKADTIDMLVDYTNVRYTASDSVKFDPGRIIIPPLRIYDKNGHSAIMSGEVTHHYFHDPSFRFDLTDADGLLCFDTNAAINPDWYGTVYGNGSGSISGYPGYVGIDIDMMIAHGSAFTFVLNDAKAAEQYDFLTFINSHKEIVVEETDSTDFETAFRRRKKVEQAGPPSTFAMDIKAQVTPQSEMTLVMDPVAGDRIRAFGNGAIQIGYRSNSDELTMFGKYVLDRGSYNFSLQDIILKDFTIRNGSSISFNGNPYQAQLDIDAMYRVNTSLTDLDKSFATDKELNRTNVPVDAVLQLRGDMQSPEISFDIELPTLTSDMKRKVMSIISTDDQMSLQMIYLLALGRFYTPEYMGISGNGGEWASMASTTLTSQLTNILSNITDKVTVAPSLRTDRGDFSDMEVDVALSSSLLNNRLLLNGNFGYRDKTKSNTTFVGDFDIEYLLNRSGNLRLKAYNHFNDQNYYLKSSLTTQGVGVIFRRDFDNLRNIFRTRKKKETKP